MENKELEGLKYDTLKLDENVHKIVGNLTKLQAGSVKGIDVEEGAMWLVTGLGYLKNSTPDELIASSLEDTIIISKKVLIEFINSKLKDK